MRLANPSEGSRRPGLAVVAVLLVVVFGLSYDSFLGADNLTAIARSSAFVLIGAIGTMALLVSGNVDLSIGSQYALVSVVTARVAVETGSTTLAVLTALALGALLGAVNGVLALVLNVSTLIITLATFGVYGGLAYAANSGQTVFGLPDGLSGLGRAELLGVPVTVWVAVATFVLGALVLMATVPGLRLFAAGSNRQATGLVGVSISRLVIGVYAANGLLIGLVALLSTAQLASGSPQVGTNYALNVLAAVILGGVAFTGGRGHPVGVATAVLLVAVLNTGLIFAGLDEWWQQVAQGVLLLVALVADELVTLRRERLVRQGRAVVAAPRVTEAPQAVPRQSPGLAGDVLTVRDLTVRYAGVTALSGVDLTVRAGEVICLVGDNGAGKSTLAKAICGAVRPSEGSVELAGETLTASPGAARRAGIETVFQELALCPHLNVADNLALGREPRVRLGGVLAVRDVEAAHVTSRQRLDELGIALADLERPVRFLSGGERQLVQILRVMRDGVRLVVMDEPTSALGLSQAAEVRALVRAIAATGTPVVLITHDVEEVFEVANRVVVLRRGEVVFDGSLEDVSRIELLRMMSGKTRMQAAQILDAVSSERKRIERDLHDGAQQGLVTAALMVGMARDRLRARSGEDDLVELLSHGQQTLQTALAEMRAFSRGLQSGVLERDGLVAAVRVLSDRAPVLADLRAGEVPRLATAVEQAAYFVVAEAFTNALKYAQADRITIELDVVGDELRVVVSDDGVGFDGATGDGSGLEGLRERVAAAHGRLEVASALGEGTRMSATFPATVLAQG